MLRKLFNLAVQWKMRPNNPAVSFRRRVEVERDRYLSMEEITRLSDALGTTEDQRAGGIIRMCVLSGARLPGVRVHDLRHTFASGQRRHLTGNDRQAAGPFAIQPYHALYSSMNSPLRAGVDAVAEMVHPSTARAREFRIPARGTHASACSIRQIGLIPSVQWSGVMFRKRKIEHGQHASEARRDCVEMRRVEVLMGQGLSRPDAIRPIGVIEQTCCRWRRQYGGRGADQSKELKQLQQKNGRLGRAASDLMPDRFIPGESRRETSEP